MIDAFSKTEKIVMQVYEIQFQIEDGPACLCFSLFSKRSENLKFQ